MRTSSCLTAVALTALCCAAAPAQQEVETVLGGLTNPCGIAIQPETGDVFVADSGAARVIRVRDGQAEDVIVGFPLDVYGKGPSFKIGPLGLAFLDKNTLVVGGGGLVDDQELLRVYEVPAAGQPAIKADQMTSSQTLKATEELAAEGNFYGVAVSKDKSAIYVSCNGDDTKGWVAKADVQGAKVTSFERFIATKEATQVDAPVAVAISPRGEVVVGQMGEINVEGDSLVTFYNAKSGEMLMNLPADGIHDITALAYSPKGQLYAADFAWMNHDPETGVNEGGGLYQLVAANNDGKQSITKKLIAELDKPTAMTFGNDGSLYITVIGPHKADQDAAEGKLLRIKPGL